MHTRSTLLPPVTILAFAASSLFASEAPPQPAAEMANLKVFDGSWACEGKANPGPMGPGGAVKSLVTSQTDLNGFWQTGTVKSTGAGMPGTMEGRFHMTYDPGAKQYVMVWIDNMGAWSQETSTGWAAGKMVFTGESKMGGQKMSVRDTFVKNADGSLEHDWEGQVDAKWTPFGSETCRKGAAAK
jgi:hypothetical protein